MTFQPEELHDDILLVQETLPPTILELEDKFARAFEPVEVDLQVRREGDKFLATGKTSTVVQVKCGRCLEWIPYSITVPRLFAEFIPPHPKTIDLTPSVREDILLKLPHIATCRIDDPNSSCSVLGVGLQPESTTPSPSLDTEVWQTLDQLNIND
ncbi:MAG: DUF177 domain-containing protein [Candidatus Methylacidiphilales bacterium]|nr:hypothetical protein [Candidatus Methylacidiphilales bacterium]